MTDSLPPNWRSAKDSDGKEYYFNELTGETSWTWPEGDKRPEMASPPVAAMVPTMASDAAEFAPAEEPPMVTAPQYGNGGKRAGGFPMAPGAAGLASTLGDGVLSRVLIMIFCSVVVTLQSAIYASRTEGDGAAESYGISVGSVSLGFSLIFLAIAKYKASTFINWTLPKIRGEFTITQLFCLFHALWWLPAAAILTFFSPFRETCNAYFATWAAFITSILMLSKAFSRVQIAMKSMSAIHEDAHVKSLAGIALSSAIVLFASIEFVGVNPEATFSLIAAVFSVVLAALMYYLVDRKMIGPPVKKGLAGIFVSLWLFAAIILTFDGPFNITTNGYFGVWFALFSSISYAYKEYVGGDLPLGSSLRRSFAFEAMESFEEAPMASVPVGSNVA